jgi:hypothetical protein
MVMAQHLIYLGIILGTVVILGVSIFIIVYYVRKNRALRYQINQKKLFNLGVEREEETSVNFNFVCVFRYNIQI